MLDGLRYLSFCLRRGRVAASIPPVSTSQNLVNLGKELIMSMAVQSAAVSVRRTSTSIWRVPLSLLALLMLLFSSAATAGKGGADRPISGKCDTVVHITGGNAAGDVFMLIELSCILSHLGRTTGLITQTVTATNQVISTITYRAANGDQLRSTYNATVTYVGPEAIFTGTETFIGGTGRFSHATGTAALSGHASLVDLTGSYTTVGTITY